MQWLYLAVAIGFELAGTVSMKLSHGFEKKLPAVFMFAFYFIAFTSLALALKKLDVGLAYAIWAGVGTALIAVIGVVYFREPMTVAKFSGLVLVIVGVVLLKMGDSAADDAGPNLTP